MGLSGLAASVYSLAVTSGSFAVGILHIQGKPLFKAK